MVRAHLKQTVSFCDPQICYRTHQPQPDNHRTVVAGLYANPSFRFTQPEEKKKATVKKKAETGSWPCKISGCSKVFAREADLKRHQRTTKLHSMPGFACPQCEATFTRTDALRRHQKSRHNGVVIEPIDQDKSKSEAGSDEEGASPKPKPKSRNGATPETPSATHHLQSIPHALPFPSNSHYYRQHTMPTGYPPPGVMIDPHYQPIGLPTSATRGSWHPTAPPQWGDNPIYVPGYYHSSPYYRPPIGSLPPQGYGPSSRHGNEHEVSASRSRRRSLSSGGSEEGSSDERPAKKVRSPSPRSAAPVIDPSLQNSSHVRAEPVKQPDEDPSATVSMEMARDALLAVIDSSKRAEKLGKEKGEAEQNGPEGPESNERGVGTVDPGRQDKPEDMEDDLEEGQEMGLSELLTQVATPILILLYNSDHS
ncbi:hypothetical protein BJ322DRAFT_715989 [Thelephora terrestris]|uniref:C2H2-type domain-containing protein n=1 Tax=Thelephora terrestris TaxID=56493 RepID=A0A9P6HHV8_9AGAM|nr:hypothetical protein BJ322DRAFT_715989 [Thelephora terrestris]